MIDTSKSKVASWKSLFLIVDHPILMIGVGQRRAASRKPKSDVPSSLSRRAASRQREREDGAGRRAPCISLASVLTVLCLLWSSLGAAVEGGHAHRPGPVQRRAACEAEPRGAVACSRFPGEFSVVHAGETWGNSVVGLGDAPAQAMRLRGGGGGERDYQIDPRMLVRDEDGATLNPKP